MGPKVVGQNFVGQDVTGAISLGQDVVGQDVVGQKFEGQDVLGQEVSGAGRLGAELRGAGRHWAYRLTRGGLEYHLTSRMFSTETRRERDPETCCGYELKYEGCCRMESC